MATRQKLGWGELDGSQSATSGKKGWGDIDLGYTIPEAVEPVPEAPPEKYTLSDFGGDAVSVATKGFIGAGEAAIGAIDWLLPGQQAKGFEALGWRPQEAKEFASSWESNELRVARKNVDDAKGFIGTLDALGDNPAALAAMIGESVPSIIGGGGLGKLAYRGAAEAGTAISGRVAAAIGEGAFGLGASAESNRQADPNRELTDKGILAAAGSGVGTGLLGFVGGKLAAKAGLGDIDTIMASGMTQATTKGFAKQLIGGGISEGVFEEMPQSIQEAMWSNFASGKDIFDGVDKAAAQGLAAGLAMGGVGGGYNRLVGDTPYKNQEQLELHRARVAGAAEAFTAAYQAYQQNPSEANQEALASAQSSYLAATKTRPSLEEAADEAGRKNAAAILTAPSVDAALEAFNRLTETSSILRTGAEAANTVAANAKKRAELAGQAATVAQAAAAANPASPAPATIDPNIPAFQENMGEVEAATLPPVVAPIPVQGSLPLEVPPTPTAAPGQGSLNFGAPAAAPVTTQAAPVTTEAAPAIWNAAPQQTKVSTFDKIKSISEKGGVTALLPASVRSLLTHDYTGSLSPIITAARDLNFPKFDNVPTILKQEGVTPEEWAQFRAEIKEKVAPARTAGVQEQIEKGTTAAGMLDYLIANADPRIGGLAKALKRFGKNNPYLALKYGNLQGTGRSRGEVGSWMETGEITDIANRAGVADEITTLHEIVHLLTMSWINTVDVASPLYKELDAMRVAATAHWKATKGMEPLPYGLTVDPKNVKGNGPEWNANAEFLAEAMANQEFQDFLRTVPATKNQSLWDKFVGWVKDVIGDPDLDLNMLGQALAVVEKAAKKSTAVAKNVEKNKITGGGKIATADTISDIASRDPMERYVERVFAHPDPNMIDKLIDANEAVGKMNREQVEAARNGPASIERSLAELYAGRMDAGFDDGFDVINEKISELEQEDAASAMNDALGIEADYDTMPEMEPDTGGTDAMEDFDPTAPVQHTPEEQAMNAALDQLWAAGGNNVATIQRTLRQSATELRLVARAAGNGARSALAAAMLRFSNIDDARVYGENRFADLLNGDIVAATESDRMAKQSDPEPSYAPGGRKPTYDFKQRLTNAYKSGALKKLAAFWQNVMSLDGQIALKTDAQSILNGQQSNNADYEKLAEAYNEEMFEKAKAWAKDHNHPAPADKPRNRIIGFIKEGKDDRGKPIIMVSVSGRGRPHRGENPYLPTTNYRGSAHIDFNPASKMNEVHAMNLEGFPGSADIAYRVLADVAKAHKLTLPTSGQLMTNNNVRRPWQTVAASLRLSDPNLLSPMSGGTSPYGMDADLWPHLNDQERIGANILRHVHNALVSRPSNGERYAKIVVSNGRALDNLSPNKDGSGFVATHEPNSPKGVAKGTKLDMREFTQLMKTVEAIGGDSTVDPEASRKGMGATSMAFAIMSQSILDEVEANPYADVPDSATKVASKLGKGQHGWFFDQTPEQKSQLQEEIEAVRAVLTNPNSTPEEQAMAREVLRTLTADDIDMKIDTLIEEINHPQTSNGRRGEINREIAALRLEQRAKRTTMLDNMGLTPEARYDAEQAIKASDAIGVPGIRLKGEHYSHQPRTELDPAKYGTGYKGAERTRVAESNDPRLRNRVYFYADAGEGIRPESGVGAVKHIAYLDNIYPAYSTQTIQQTIPNTLSGDAYMNAFETAVLDAGYRGYSNNFGHQLAVVVFGSDPIPVMTEADIEAEASDPVVRENKLQDKPEAPLLNIGLDVGAGDRKMKINPSTARMLIERTGAKITRSNVVESTYTHKGEQVIERTLVAELDRPLNEAEATKLAELAQQEAISQRNNGDNNLFGPKASEWGAFDPTQFVLLDGKKMATRISSEDAAQEEQVQIITRDEPIPPAVEQKIIEQPVSPAYPNMVRMAARSAQGAFEKRLEKLRVRWQEQHATLARVLKNLGIKAEDIGMDVLGAITRSKGLIQSNLENLVRDPLAKIENDLFNAGVKDHKAKIEAYLKWRHVPEANAQAAKINPYNARTGMGFNLTDRPGSGITTEEAVRNLAEMDQSPDGPALREAAKQFDAMITGLQNYAVERGLESADTIAAWRNVFPNYAPFYRDLDLSDTFSTGAQGYSTRSGVSRRFMGSEAEIQPILASTRLLGQRIVNRGETARVAQTLLKLAKNNTPMFKGKGGKWHPMWVIDTFPNVRTVKVVNVYRFKDIDGNYVLNGGGVPIEFYSQNAADAYLETNTNAKGGPKSVESLGPKERMVVAQNPDYISRDNVVIVPVNGENVAVVFNDESEDAREMYRNLKNMDTQHLGPILAAPAMVSRWVVATATGYNPIFSLFNFARDIQATAVNMNAENIPGWNSASDTAAVVGESFRNVFPLMFYLQRKQNKLHSNEKIDITPTVGSPEWWMEKAKAAGGLTGIMDSLVGMSESEAQIRELFGVERKAKEAVDPAIERVDKLDRVHERFMGAVEWLEGAVDGEGKDVYAKAIGAVTTRIANLNQGAELATRTAAFKAAYEKFIADGKTDAEASTLAANISKGISVNFNRKGQWSGVAGAAFPFFNAAAQGSARFFESVFEKESVKAFDEDGQPVMHQTTKLTPFGMKLVTALPALGILQAVLLAGYDDDEISEADKSRNFIIPAPWGEGGIIKIPLPLGLNVPFNMGREMADMVIHPENFVRHATNLIMEPISGFNPLGGAGNHIQTMMPAIMDPIVGLLQNRDAFGRPIAKEDFDKSKPTPGHTRAKEGASTFGKGVSYGINYATGGGKYGIGAVSPTPDQVDYVLGQVFGGVGRETMKALGTGARFVEDRLDIPREEVPWYKVSLAGKVYGNVNEVPNVKAQIYDAKTKVAELKYEHAKMLKAGDREAASAFLAEHPEIKLASRIDATLKEEAELRKMRAAAREKDDVAAAQKANEQIDAKLIKLRDEIRKIRGD